MGNCVSGKKKEKNHNKTIINNQLKNKNPPPKESNDFILIKPNSFSIPVKLIITQILQDYKSSNEIILTIEPNKTIKELFNLLKINIQSEYDIQLRDGQIVSNVDKNKKINEIFYQYITNNDIVQNGIYFNLIYKGLQIPENIKESYINKNPIIGSPIFDNPDFFAIITFNTKSKELKFFNFDSNISEISLLNKFNSFTAYCNANGNLYISGGENEQSEDFEKSVIEYNDFFCIDLNKLNSNNNDINEINTNVNGDNNSLNDIKIKNEFNIKHLPNLLEPRTWHSMIFVPEKYIFIVGGLTKSVEIYDIEKNILEKDSELNEMRSECTLCMVNNIYLYAFCGFLLHQTFNCSVEKCNLRKSHRTWEYVNFNKSNNFLFIPSFFCVSYYKNDEIILVGGNDSIEEQNKSYVVKIGKEENLLDDIYEFNLGEEKFGVFRDKFFTPIDNNYAINIPLIYGEHIQLLLLNMDTGEIEQKFYNDIFNIE